MGLSKELIKLNWVKYIDIIGGSSSAACIYGDILAVVGEAGIAFLDRETGDVIAKRVRGSKSEYWKSCVVIDDRLYIAGSFGSYYILEFNRDLSISRELGFSSREGQASLDIEALDIAYDSRNLYIAGRNRATGRLYVEKRSRSLDLLDYREVIMEKWGSISINSIGFNQASNTLWIAGYYLDRGKILRRGHTLIIVLGRDLNIVKVVDYPGGHENYLGELGSLCFDDKGYTYVGGRGVAKLDWRGNIVKIVKGIPAKKILCAGELIYAFGNEYLDGYWRHVISILDRDLNLLHREILSRDAEFDSYFTAGRVSFDGTNIFVAGNDEALGRASVRWVVYSIEAPKVERHKAVPGISSSVERLVQILTAKIKNLVPGYGCYQPETTLFRAELVSKIAPQGFEGVWECCVLGCGGWGCSYLCRQGGREAVFKVPRGFEGILESRSLPTIEKKVMERIALEAEVVKGLDHPNILKLLGFSHSVPLLVYEYADHGSLAWQLSRGWRPSLGDVLLAGIQVGDALRYIHSRGLVHSDIKPANIFIKDSVVKLGDFSLLVKLLSSVSKTTGYGYTAGFRAPEQVYSDLMRKARGLGYENRIDVYQLGNLLLYLLTGETVDGEDAADEKIVSSKLATVENDEMRKILERILVLDPAERPSAEEVVKRLLEIYSKI